MAKSKFAVEMTKAPMKTLSKGVFSGNAAGVVKAAMTPKYDTSGYDKQIADFNAHTLANADAEKKKKSAEYDEQARQAYISRLQNEKKLSEKLANAGIRGGATETSNLNLQANYETNRNKIASEKISGLQAIDQNANNLIFQNRQTVEADKLKYLQQREAEDREREERLRQEKVQADQAKKQNDETRYAATISRYTSVDSINKAIKNIKKWKKTNPAKYKANSWKLQYLGAQRAVLKAKKKKK